MESDTTLKMPDVVLIGAGIMSATLGAILKQLKPDLLIHIYERLDKVAEESSDPWNNAGTGHSAFCELNYTPEKPDGTIDISKAIKIASQFETSKQFWAYAVSQSWIKDPGSFITPVPHMSFVWGKDNVEYLCKRHDAMVQHPLFEGMLFSTDRQQLEDWIPLMMEGRSPEEEVAVTRMEIGTDLNFGSLTRQLFDHLTAQPGVQLFTSHEIRDIDREEADDNSLGHPNWKLRIKNLVTGEKIRISTPFVFIGAGGGALPLLEKADIPEAEGFGGFPVSGQWLICHNDAVVKRHHAKVYGKADVGTPPMSVPHLDTRNIDGKPALLFGPYAGFSTRFLKHGSLMDLPLSLRWSNLKPMLSAGIHNIPLTKYLINQVEQSDEERMDALIHFMPKAEPEDWKLAIAGQRVQVIKQDEEAGGVLEFGTEIVSAKDGSIAALLGASPGASTSVSIMLDVLSRCFDIETMKAGIQEMIPTFGIAFQDDAGLVKSTRARSHSILHLPQA